MLNTLDLTIYLQYLHHIRALYRYLHMHIGYMHKNAKIPLNMLFSDLRYKPHPPPSTLDAHIFRNFMGNMDQIDFLTHNLNLLKDIG